MVLAPAMQASRNPVSLPLAPTINSAIRAKVGNNGRMPGRVLPRFDSQTIAAVIRPPTMPFQTISLEAYPEKRPNPKDGRDQEGRRPRLLFSRHGFFTQRQTEAVPDLQQRVSQPVDQSIVVIGGRRDPQALGAFCNGRVIDR